MAITITIAGVSGGVVPWESLRISEAMGAPGPSPTVATFEIIDTAATIAIPDLADVVIVDGDEALFRGQVVDTEMRPVATRRHIAVTAEAYSRLVPGCLVQPGGADFTYLAGIAASWRSIAKTAGYGFMADLATWVDDWITAQGEWLGRWSGMTGAIFGRIIRQWWHEDRSALAVPITRNSTTLAAAMGTASPGAIETITIASPGAMVETVEYHAMVGTEQVRVTDGYGTTSLQVERGTNGIAGAHASGTPFLGPMTDTTTHIAAGGALPAGGITWLDVPLDTVLSDLCTFTSPGAMWWLDADLAWHFVTSPPAAPADFSDAPDYATSWPTEGLRVRRAGRNIARRLWIRGQTVAGSGFVDVSGAPGFAPEVAVGAPAVAATARNAYAAGEATARKASLITASWSTTGGNGWHAGQLVHVTNAAAGLASEPLVIRALTLSVLTGGGVRRWDFEAGDVRDAALSRSVSGSRRERPPRDPETHPPEFPVDAPKAPAVAFVMMPLYTSKPRPGESQLVTFQLATRTGEPVSAAGIEATWTLWKNDVDMGVGGVGDGSYLRDTYSTSDAQGQIVNLWTREADSVDGDDFEVTVSAAP